MRLSAGLPGPQPGGAPARGGRRAHACGLRLDAVWQFPGTGGGGAGAPGLPHKQ